VVANARIHQEVNSKDYEAFTKAVSSKVDYPPIEIKIVEKSNPPEKKINYDLIIASIAIILSIYSLFRDRKNKQFEMLHQSASSVKELNRTIAGTISDVDQRKKVFLTELKNEFEFLAFFVNRKQIESKDVFSLEGKFIRKLVKDTKLARDDYPEIFTLLDRWRRERKRKRLIHRILNSKHKAAIFKKLLFKSKFCHCKG
jgi:hypothetical protein